MAFYDTIIEAAKWLDGVEPEWYKKVNTKTLDMNHCNQCVLGQVFGNYWDACPKYNIPESRNNAFGHNTNKELWIEEINSRVAPKLTALQKAENRIAELEARLQEEKAKLEALRNPEISVTMTQSEWQHVTLILGQRGYTYPKITKASIGE